MFRTSLRSSFNILRSNAPATIYANRLIAHRFLSQEARSAIQKAIESKPVVLFMKGTPSLPECGFSRAVVQVLNLHGVPADKLQAYNVLSDSELRSGIKEFSSWPTIPQIYINGEFVGGCDILLGMHQSGELEDLLVKKEIIPAELPADSAAPSS